MVSHHRNNASCCAPESRPRQWDGLRASHTAGQGDGVRLRDGESRNRTAAGANPLISGSCVARGLPAPLTRWTSCDSPFARSAAHPVSGRGPPVQVRVARVTVSFFSTLQVRPAFGRGPGEGEDVAGGPRTAVLTDSFWRREFGGDRGVLGRTLVLDGSTYEIGGVMPADFHFPLL